MVFTEEQKCELRLRILVNGEKASNIAAEYGMTAKSFQQALSSKKSSKKTVKQSYNHIHGVEISRKNGESLTSLSSYYNVSRNTLNNFMK